MTGAVYNDSSGVTIIAQGISEKIDRLIELIQHEHPPLARIDDIEIAAVEQPINYQGFHIQKSDTDGTIEAVIAPDIATCPRCLGDIFDPGNRRYLYPFTNCTDCGPRYSIILDLPYDRSNTTMRGFQMCERCQAEYHDPIDRRFHAQPNACPDCGPYVSLWDRQGKTLAVRHDAIVAACKAIKQGAIVAVKGLGGFQLVADASNDEAVTRLRELKQREQKPFAVMFPSMNVLLDYCILTRLQSGLLLGRESPIVLAHKRSAGKKLSSQIAPGNPYLGVMLPYTPLHHILMHLLGIAVVATSGNISHEPICIDEHEALSRLGGIADLFLAHNRPIARHVDDSVVRVIAGQPMILRRARGYAPLPIQVNLEVKAVALGAHLKNTVAVSMGKDAFISQHIGDLETEQAFQAFKRTIADLIILNRCQPEVVLCDAHPDYLSTVHARSMELPVVAVQHHHAHILACMAENGLQPPCLGIAWDGTGYGGDGTIWGGEFLRINSNGDYERVAHLRHFPLPGAELAIKEPRRAALGLIYQLVGLYPIYYSRLHRFLASAFTNTELSILLTMLKKRINSPLTSSIGRLFDAVAALCRLRYINSFEGQAAMELEHAIEQVQTTEAYNINIDAGNTGTIIDHAPLIQGILDDLGDCVPISIISARFHNTLIAAAVQLAERVGLQYVALSGGCFQNRYLSQRMIAALQGAGFKVFTHRLVPTNDGGISLGQLAYLAYKGKEG